MLLKTENCNNWRLMTVKLETDELVR